MSNEHLLTKNCRSNLTMKGEYMFPMTQSKPRSAEAIAAANIYGQHRRALISGCEKAWKIEEDVMAKRTTLADHYKVI